MMIEEEHRYGTQFPLLKTPLFYQQPYGTDTIISSSSVLWGIEKLNYFLISQELNSSIPAPEFMYSYVQFCGIKSTYI